MKKIIAQLFMLFGLLAMKAQVTTYSVKSQSNNFTLSCINPSFSISVDSLSIPITFTCSGPSFTPNSATGTMVTITTPGSYSVQLSQSVILLSVTINTTIPISSISSTFQVVSGTLAPTTITALAISPTLNVTQYFYSPQGGTMVTTGYYAIYVPGGIGTYTHCIINDENGCISCQPFTIAYGSPGTVGLSEPLLPPNELFLFPNPAQEIIYLRGFESLKTNQQLIVVNSLGEKLLEEKLNANVIRNGLHTETLLDGIYSLYILEEKSPTISKRLVIKR